MSAFFLSCFDTSCQWFWLNFKHLCKALVDTFEKYGKLYSVNIQFTLFANNKVINTTQHTEKIMTTRIKDISKIRRLLNGVRTRWRLEEIAKII